MKPDEFVAKWSHIRQKETAVYASHFDDLCRLAGHPTPTEHAARHDPTGQVFSFQTTTVKADGQKGFADVFFRGRFIWEYKGLHADLDRAYRQLQLYREALDNPPLLITSDLHTIHIHTNFTNRPVVETVVTLDDIAAGPGVEVLRRVFFDPAGFMPDETRQTITKATADTFLTVAEALRQHQRLTGEAYTPEQRAHFLIRLLFCLFAEDLGLLPKGLFTDLVRSQGQAYTDLRHPLRNLFAAMRDGGHFGMFAVRHFNGTLFDDEFVPALPYDLAQLVLRAARQDWAAVDPSIFGTLFERIIDDDKRAQLGAHYTSQDDILLIVEPVLMEPLRRRWDEVRRVTSDELAEESGGEGKPGQRLIDFAHELSQVRVLDPACGSGNFLYVALRRLLDLQKEVISYAARQGLPEIPLTVGPQQLYGIEINEYAHELAQVTVWIGYLQWRFENGFAAMNDPVLRPLGNIRRMDAILAHDAEGRPVEPAWPAAEVIIGNPPFLGGKKTLTELGQAYMNDLREVYKGRLPGFSDLVVYWFEQAREQIQTGKTKRAGLIATNSISMGTNLPVLKRIKESGDIFLAWDDRDWILDGAAVRVAIIGFDDGTEHMRVLNSQPVNSINADLTSNLDLTQALQLKENSDIAFIGTQKSGSFDIQAREAKNMIATPNPSGVSNADVVLPWVNGEDLVRRPRGLYAIYFPETLSMEEAEQYQAPFTYAKEVVQAERTAAHFRGYPFWLHWRPRPALREAVVKLQRFIITPRVSKHRIFVWMTSQVIADSATVAIARDDDYFFGVLHARPHELWALRMGTSLEDRPRYTPTTTFETYPFPWPPGQEPPPDLTGGGHLSGLVEAIAHRARALVQWRDAWLNPPPPQKGTMDVAYDRLIKARTLTNLYNGLVYFRAHRGVAFDRAAFDKETRKSATPADIQELDDLHRALDAAVFRAYGWPETLSDEEILERLLALNRERG